MTERLVELGFEVVAVEPSDGMRAELLAVAPGRRRPAYRSECWRADLR